MSSDTELRGIYILIVFIFVIFRLYFICSRTMGNRNEEDTEDRGYSTHSLFIIMVAINEYLYEWES